MRIGNPANPSGDSLITQNNVVAISDVKSDIANRDATTPLKVGHTVLVLDASDDNSVGSNSNATYVWNGTSWELTSYKTNIPYRIVFHSSDLDVNNKLVINGGINIVSVLDNSGLQYNFSDEDISFNINNNQTTVDITSIMVKKNITEISGDWYFIIGGGPKGDGIYEEWLLAGHTGTREDFLNWVFTNGGGTYLPKMIANTSVTLGTSKSCPLITDVTGDGTTVTATVRTGESTSNITVGDVYVIRFTTYHDGEYTITGKTDTTLSWSSTITNTESSLTRPRAYYKQSVTASDINNAILQIPNYMNGFTYNIYLQPGFYNIGSTTINIVNLYNGYQFFMGPSTSYSDTYKSPLVCISGDKSGVGITLVNISMCTTPVYLSNILVENNTTTQGMCLNPILCNSVRFVGVHTRLIHSDNTLAYATGIRGQYVGQLIIWYAYSNGGNSTVYSYGCYTTLVSSNTSSVYIPRYGLVNQYSLSVGQPPNGSVANVSNTYSTPL